MHYDLKFNLNDNDYYEYNCYHHENSQATKNGRHGFTMLLLCLPFAAIFITVIRGNTHIIFLLAPVFFVISIIFYFLSKSKSFMRHAVK